MTGQSTVDVAEVSPGCGGRPEREAEVGRRDGSVKLQLNGEGSVEADDQAGIRGSQGRFHLCETARPERPWMVPESRE